MEAPVIPPALLDLDLASRYKNGLIRLVEDGDLQFDRGPRAILDNIYGNRLESATISIATAAARRRLQEESAVHPLSLLDWVIQRADVIDGLRSQPAFSAVRLSPSIEMTERWRWMMPVRSCRVPMMQADYYDFMEVVRQLESHRDQARTLVVDHNRQSVYV